MRSVGMMCTSARVALASPLRLSRFFRAHFQLLDRGLRGDEIGFAGGDLLLGLQHVQRRHGSDFQLLLVVAQQLLRQLQGLLRDVHRQGGADQIPVGGNHGIQGGVQLLLELVVGHPEVVLGDPDVARVDRPGRNPAAGAG